MDVSMAGECVTSNITEELKMVEYVHFVISHLTKKEMVALHQIHRCQCIPSDQAARSTSRDDQSLQQSTLLFDLYKISFLSWHLRF